MRFAATTLVNIVHGTPAQRHRAIAAFSLWFVAGAYVTSTLLFYASSYEGVLAEILGGAAVACCAAAVKLS